MPARSALPLKRRVARWAEGVQNQALDRTVELVRQDAPLGKVTPTSRPPGTLRRSIRRRPGVRGGLERMTGTIEAPVIQARTTDQGSPPHVIRARNAPLLRFYWPKVGRIVYFKQVNHPGNPPQHWWEPALRKRWGQALRTAARRVRF